MGRSGCDLWDEFDRANEEPSEGQSTKLSDADVSDVLEQEYILEQELEAQVKQDASLGNYRIVLCGLRELRRKRGVTQAEMASALNCGQAALSKYELMQRNMTVPDLLNALQLLNVEPDMFFKALETAGYDSPSKQFNKSTFLAFIKDADVLRRYEKATSGALRTQETRGASSSSLRIVNTNFG